MAIYKFRVKFEEYDEVVRDVEVKATQTFKDLYDVINEAIGFDGKLLGSFYLSDEHWKKGAEFTNDSARLEKPKVRTMKDSKLTAQINDPHQKIYFVMEAEIPWEFQIELIKIVNEEPSTKYPRCIRTAGVAPKQYGKVNLELPPEEFDFIGEEVFTENEGDEGDGDPNLTIDGIVTEGGEDSEVASSDEFGEENLGDPEQE